MTSDVIATLNPTNNFLLFQIKISYLIEAGIKCLKPEYIAAFLMEVPSPNMDSYLISELWQKIKVNFTSLCITVVLFSS